MLLCTLIAGALSLCAQGQAGSTPTPPASPNEPGILDPVVVELLHQPFRLAGTDQVAGDSELVNLVGKVKRKKARGAPSAKGATIQNDRSPAENVASELEAMATAALNGDGSSMRTSAALLLDLLSGNTSGYLSDGFPLLHDHREGLAPDHLPGEFRMKRLERSPHSFIDDQGVTRWYWQVKWRVLWTASGAETDMAMLEVPADVDPLDRLLVHYEVYASATDEVGLMSFVKDGDLSTADGLPFKGLDSTWVRLLEEDIQTFSVDHGALGSLREIAMRGSRLRPEPMARVDLIQEVFDVHQQDYVREARGQALAAAARRADFDSIADAAPEKKIWQVAEAALQGASTQQVAAALLRSHRGPKGTWQEWAELLGNRRMLPGEALEILAAEGITPGLDPEEPLGPYDFVAVKMNHEWYGLSAQESRKPFAPPVERKNAKQGSMQSLKVINLDHLEEGVQLSDFGPALLHDIGNCYNAPWGWKSLEIFSDKPLWGYPKSAELYWRTAWGFRPHAGVVEQYDLFPRARDRSKLARFTDSFGTLRRGWQYPAAMRGADFRVDPPLSELGRVGRPALHELRGSDGQPGVVIGTTTNGYGTAHMPYGDLSGHHPLALVNTDTDGDQIPDALIFPTWLRNPDLNGGDVILSSPEWTPFLYLNPNNGTVWNDPAQPELGLWGHQSFGLGSPVQAGQDLRIDWMRPRALGQAVWLDSGSVRAFGGLPLTMRY